MLSKDLKEYARNHDKSACYTYNNLLWNSRLISETEYSDNITHILKTFL